MIFLNAGDSGFIPGSGRFPGEGTGNPLQYSGLENAMDVHGIKHSKDQTHNILPPIFTYQY